MPSFYVKVISKRYVAVGDQCETDEFLKPIIVDPEGRIQGRNVQCTVQCDTTSVFPKLA